ncbi:MAG: hypothetical protein KC486_24045 [Myxococcales bacterium]|nr:hypothetical protein [Myxococcales bacterium]
MVIALAACKGVGDGGATSGAELDGVLNLEAAPIKRFDFSWEPHAEADFYRLLERPSPAADYTQVGEDVDGEALSLTVPLHLRWGADYLLQSCDGDGCTDYAALTVDDDLAGAVGYVKASNPGSADLFGEGVAISCAGDVLAVGAPGENSGAAGIDGEQGDNSQESAGAAYVYRRSDAGWLQEAYVKPSEIANYGTFGFAVALSCAGDVLAVGSPGAGRVYLFRREGEAWSEEAAVDQLREGFADNFGVALALSSDGSTLAVGAPRDNTPATGINSDIPDGEVNGAGAAYVFVRSGEQWSRQAYIKPSVIDSGYDFGRGVTISADGDTLVAGAGGADEGAAFVFTRAGTTWSEVALVRPAQMDTNDIFGRSVALSADGQTLAVGALREDGGVGGVNDATYDNNADGSGAVYIFANQGGSWTERAYIKALPPQDGEGFGGSVALSADGRVLAVGLDDASASVGIGGDAADGSLHLSGGVFVYAYDDDEWSPRAFVKASNAGLHDGFGGSVALSADGGTMAVGARNEKGLAAGVGGAQSDNSGFRIGAAYLY